MDKFKELAFGSRLKRLSDSFMRDGKRVYKDLHLDFEPTLMPVFKTIYDEKEISIGEIAKQLEISQPAVTQFVNNLLKRKLLKVLVNKKDKRIKKVALNNKGFKTIEKLQPIWVIFEEQLKDITTNKNLSFLEHLRLIEKKQKKYSIYNRVMDRLKKNIEIISYEEKYAHYFYNLNIEWLKKYFYVEDYDEKVLSNPKKYVLDPGGFIFFAKYNNEIVGVVSLINQKTFFELSKMAVSPKYQGLKIGQKLMDYSIDFAKKQGWKSITLYSSRKLIPAINLYKKIGFREIPVEENSHYERSDIKMILDL
ncbi:helix-turn-helix domain-containing GNAT family N-acetyltransferase [uncultured Polaribacter sp.]|uniref:helix-turn-helix domain-containing GNAT family N-acetyltransferase n=1 Tax=uncultured Polaribacter sp. TaxID=174711 RepID=UPI00262595EF|nr:helix-turn-helix domain-containing GNAT family N-acetyltransferase [uncultured Polaribacter sp.]